MIWLEKWKMLTPLQKLPKNVGDLGKLIVAKDFKKLPKVKTICSIRVHWWKARKRDRESGFHVAAFVYDWTRKGKLCSWKDYRVVFSVTKWNSQMFIKVAQKWFD